MSAKNAPDRLAHLSKTERTCLEHFRQKLFSTFTGNVKEFILFGSKARGDDVPGSDLDVLVTFNSVSRDLRNKVYDLACDIEEENRYLIHLSPLVWETAYFERLALHERRIALDIQKEGIRI